jgi:hypothetical protein
MWTAFWTSGLFRWWRKTKPERGGGRVDFSARLRIIHDDGWVSLELLLVNRSNVTVWVADATVVLTDLDTDWQAGISTGQARQAICQNVRPNDALSVSIAGAIYDAAGRPQGPYSCFVLTNVRYRVFDEWCDAQPEKCRVEMAALTAVAVHSASWYDKKMKHIKGPVDLTAKEHKGYAARC